MYLYVHSVRDFSGFLLYDSFSAFFYERIGRFGRYLRVSKNSPTFLAQESRLAVVAEAPLLANIF